MIITTTLSSLQLSQVYNLMVNCTTKQDMFDHLLVKCNINAFNALHMSNSYNPLKYSFSILPISKYQQRVTKHCENGKIVLTEV
jgi:hypothetical protein